MSPALEEFLAEAYRRLSRGVADRRSAFHTPTLATVAPDGAPEARTLVLRGFDPPMRTLRLHTDARSGKVAALAREPRCELHFYDAGAKLQLRLSGRGAVHGGDPVAERAWAETRDFSRLVYAVDPAPGTPVEAPPPAPRDAAGAAAHFRVILLRFDRLDLLELASAGHRRARFDWAGDAGSDAAVPHAAWLVP